MRRRIRDAWLVLTGRAEAIRPGPIEFQPLTATAFVGSQKYRIEATDTGYNLYPSGA